MQRTGYLGLSRAVERLGFQTSSPLQVDFASASIGSLNEEFLKNIYAAAQGHAPHDERKIARIGESGQAPDLSDSFRIYFPTHETVSNSIGGTDVSRRQLLSHVTCC